MVEQEPPEAVREPTPLPPLPHLPRGQIQLATEARSVRILALVLERQLLFSFYLADTSASASSVRLCHEMAHGTAGAPPSCETIVRDILCSRAKCSDRLPQCSDDLVGATAPSYRLSARVDWCWHRTRTSPAPPSRRVEVNSGVGMEAALPSSAARRATSGASHLDRMEGRSICLKAPTTCSGRRARVLRTLSKCHRRWRSSRRSAPMRTIAPTRRFRLLSD